MRTYKQTKMARQIMNNMLHITKLFTRVHYIKKYRYIVNILAVFVCIDFQFCPCE